MELKTIGAVISFFAAFAIGAAVGTLAHVRTEVPVVYGSVETVTPRERAPFEMEMLVGKWAGKWDHDYSDCTVEIDRVAGNNFYGTLMQNGAKIAFKGSLDPKTRKVAIHETKVLALGVYGFWSLGENEGQIAADGLTLSGTGHDKWGEYDWSVSLGSPVEE